MRGLIARWIVLGPVMWLTLAAVLWCGFRTIDVRFETFAALMVVPAAQAVILTWAIRGTPRAMGQVISSIARLPFGSTAAILDLAMLLMGLVFWRQARLGFGVSSSLQIVWAATKAVAAGCLLFAGLRRSTTVLQAAVAVTAILLGLSGFTAWLGGLPFVLVRLVGRMPLVLAYVLTYGAAGTALVALLLRFAARQPAHGVRRRLVECAVGALLVAALVLVLNGFKYRIPMEPYRGLALLAASIAASAMLFAAEQNEESA
jgi:hypothetical protein